MYSCSQGLEPRLDIAFKVLEGLCIMVVYKGEVLSGEDLANVPSKTVLMLNDGPSRPALAKLKCNGTSNK